MRTKDQCEIAGQVPMKRADVIEDMWYPNLGTLTHIVTSKSTILGEVANWAVQQSPYTLPETLPDVLTALAAKIDGLDIPRTGDILEFTDLDDLTDKLRNMLRAIPEYVAWNERKNGNNAPMHFTSRYDASGDPDNDFIDLGALERNVTTAIARDFALL